MRKTLLVFLLAALLLLEVGVIVFHYWLDLAWIDAALLTMTTFGFGDLELTAAPPGVKVFGIFLILVGAATLAALFGVITDIIIRFRLKELLGHRRKKVKDHIVLCGLGNVGFRILQHLRRLGEKVVVIEKSAEGDFFESARRLGVDVVLGDMRMPDVLEDAGIRSARALIAAGDEDLVNLEAALNAKSVNEDIRIVMRMFDQSLANKVQKGFNLQKAFSTSALAAPSFAMAAVDPAVIGSFYVGGELMLNLELIIETGSRLDGMNTAQLLELGDVSILAHEPAGDGARRFHPSEPILLKAGDKLVVSSLPDFARRLHELNHPG